MSVEKRVIVGRSVEGKKAWFGFGWSNELG